MHVLRLDAAGTPTAWITRQEAAVLYAKDLIAWEIGSTRRLHGGINRFGSRSVLDVHSVIAVKGPVSTPGEVRGLTNRMLFKRDHYRCMYCGYRFEPSMLTRDHVTPRAQGGLDVPENVVAACRKCNGFKADRTPEQANMPLLAVPFRPNLFEWMYLAQRTVLADQMEYLESRFSGRRQWAA